MIEKWRIYRASLDPVVGSEQGKSRPVLVISEDAINNLLNVVNILPITSRKPGRTIYPNEVLTGDGHRKSAQRIGYFMPSNQNRRQASAHR